jgi:hypothetical protein
VSITEGEFLGGIQKGYPHLKDERRTSNPAMAGLDVHLFKNRALCLCHSIKIFAGL